MTHILSRPLPASEVPNSSTGYKPSPLRTRPLPASPQHLAMGRPKLHPDDRKRVTEACNACRVSKKRCSATVPCTHCLKRGIGDTCFLTHQPRRVRRVHNENERTDASRVEAATIHVGGSEVEDANNDEFAASAASTGTYTEQTPNANGPIRHNGRQTTPRSSPRRDSIFTHRQASSLGSQTSCTAPESHSRMLLNRRGDRGTLIKTPELDHH